MLNVRFPTVSVIAFVSTAVTVPRNGSVVEDVAVCFLTGVVCAAAGVVAGAATGATAGAAAGALLVACARDDAGTTRMAAAHKVSIESFAMCFFILVEN